MQFGLLGVNFKDAPLDIRDKASFTEAGKLEFFQKAAEAGAVQCMVLSTCNRSEVFYLYEETGDGSVAGKLQRIYQGMFPEAALEGYLRELEGKEAMAYLFRITAGLESLVLGRIRFWGRSGRRWMIPGCWGIAARN